MFKRIQKHNDRLEKDQKKGINIEDQGPPEMALDDESDSESSSSSEAETEGDESSSGSDGSSSSSSSSSKSGKVDVKAKKGKEESSDEEESKDGSDDDDNDEDGEDSSSSSAAEEDVDDAPACSIEKAKEDPIFIHPRAAAHQGFKHRSCYLCPVALLKSEKMISTHLGGNSHARRRKRFEAYCNSKLKEEERKDPKEGGLDVTKVVQKIDKALEVKAQRQVKHRQTIKLQMKEKKHRKMSEKKENKLKKKAEKEEKKKRYLAMRADPSLNPDPKKFQITPEGKLVREVKKEKAKRQKKLNRVMPTKAERKARKKEKKEVKMAARKEAARIKAREGALKNKATAAATET
ncbi:hypothetical protein CBS101457_005213 [Exobasidium rhododendri]|nr:hypothetical protein CBS101457_005213 [Exobasidium rhododendri]